MSTNQDNTINHISSYVEQMTKKEKRAYEIAKSHLQTSFDLEKSIGYKKFIQKLQEQQQTN